MDPFLVKVITIRRYQLRQHGVRPFHRNLQSERLIRFEQLIFARRGKQAANSLLRNRGGLLCERQRNLPERQHGEQGYFNAFLHLVNAHHDSASKLKHAIGALPGIR